MVGSLSNIKNWRAIKICYLTKTIRHFIEELISSQTQSEMFWKIYESSYIKSGGRQCSNASPPPPQRRFSQGRLWALWWWRQRRRSWRCQDLFGKNLGLRKFHCLQWPVFASGDQNRVLEDTRFSPICRLGYDCGPAQILAEAASVATPGWCRNRLTEREKDQSRESQR